MSLSPGSARLANEFENCGLAVQHMSPTVVSVIGNPRPDSRTHHLARTLAGELASALGFESGEVDLAQLGASVLDFQDETAIAAAEEVLAADVLVLASPSYKATYSGLLEASSITWARAH